MKIAKSAFKEDKPVGQNLHKAVVKNGQQAHQLLAKSISDISHLIGQSSQLPKRVLCWPQWCVTYRNILFTIDIFAHFCKNGVILWYQIPVDVSKVTPWRARSLSLRASNIFFDMQFVIQWFMFFWRFLLSCTFGVAIFARAKASVSRKKAGVFWAKWFMWLLSLYSGNRFHSDLRCQKTDPPAVELSRVPGLNFYVLAFTKLMKSMQASLTKASEFLGSALTMEFGQWGHQVPRSPCWFSQSCALTLWFNLCTSIWDAPNWHFYTWHIYTCLYISPALQAGPVAWQLFCWFSLGPLWQPLTIEQRAWRSVAGSAVCGPVMNFVFWVSFVWLPVRRAAR